MSVGPIPGADAGGAGDRVGGGDEGIGAVVEVEQGRLGALEEDRAAVVERLPAEPGGVGDVGLEPVAVAGELLGHRVQVQARVGRLGDRLVGSLAAALACLLAQFAALHREFAQRLLLGLQRRA